MDLPPALTWIGIAFCLSQSAMFSGLNLAYFSIGRLRLEAEVENGNKAANKILKLRQDANFLLCTILWGNVAVNVLLAMLVESALPAVVAFFVSTLGITFFGEIMPQAYFSRNAIRMGSVLSPLIRFYQILLWPFARPSSFILDGWIGAEGINYMRERDLEVILEKHIGEKDSEISETEGRGALNFLDLDDRLIAGEGNVIDAATIHSFPTKMDLPIFPDPGTPEGDAFLEKLRRSGRSHAVITDETGEPLIVLKTSRYLFQRSLDAGETDIYAFCHRPILTKDPKSTLDHVLGEFVVEADNREDHIVDRDVVIFWTKDSRRIITGADIFGRLLEGIARREQSKPSIVKEGSSASSRSNL